MINRNFGKETNVKVLPIEIACAVSTPESETEALEHCIETLPQSSDVRGLIGTYSQIESFAINLARFFTRHFPGTSMRRRSAVAEVLETAAQAYWLHNTDDGVDDAEAQVAAFLCAGISSATDALLHWNVMMVYTKDERYWHPWKDRSLSQYIGVDAEPIQWLKFTHALAACPETRYIARNLMENELLEYSDLMLIARLKRDN